jgi:hypothetical protein
MKSPWMLAVVPLILLTLSGTALAQVECETDADCAVGFRCEAVEVGACPEPFCPEGEECPEPDPCEAPEPFSACVPGPCDSDADCGAGLLCLEVTSYDCPASPPPCDPEDESCEPPDSGSGECTEETEGYCLPPYLAPCEADADCGPGFECVESEICSCSGSEPGSGEEPECSCEPGDSYCEIVVVECESAADCLEDWTCEEVGGEGTCSYDPSTGEETCEEVPANQACLPPYFWDVGWGTASGADESALDSATGGEDSRVTGEIERDEPSSSGCRAAPGRAGDGLAALALAALALLASRRRG